MPKTKSKQESYGVFLIPSFGILLTFVLGCWLWNVGISFTRWDGLSAPEFVGFKNYAYLFSAADFWRAFGNAALFVIPMALIPTALGMVLSALFYEQLNTTAARRILTFVRSAIYLPQVFSLMVSGVVWHSLLNNSGLLNQALTNLGQSGLAQDWLNKTQWAYFWLFVIMIWIQLGYTFVIFLAGMMRVDPAILEAAQMDGASWFKRFRYITAHQLYPELAVVILVTTVGALKVFGPVYFITGGGPFGATDVPTTFSFFAFFGGNNVGFGSAVSSLLSLLVMGIAVLLLRLQRHAIFAELDK